ncbi:DUF6531 domain-containing protein [Kitasatospora sp. NBC_01287]|uniref:DUF6531 domain-containing protein n=1 Tax=Kitasatospora sp. NBC_01287 TaxID=2903573 RepID=UPI0022539D12|nr:DUF6531 domain-containing protein [Kitasatospora sp. NBC_01287]MCX4745966.1 DUF6531 domain-containing protein [Kitasatospora sp. NBC_01287]
MQQKQQQEASLGNAGAPADAQGPAVKTAGPNTPGFHHISGTQVPPPAHPTVPVAPKVGAAKRALAIPDSSSGHPYIANLRYYADTVQAGNTGLSWCATWDFNTSMPANLGTQAQGGVSVALYRSSDNTLMDAQQWNVYRATGYCAMQPQLQEYVDYYLVVSYNYIDGTNDTLTSFPSMPDSIKGVPSNVSLACPNSPASTGIVLDLVKYCGDPVNTSTGAFGEAVTDAELSGPGAPFMLTRSYSSSSTTSSVLGAGWAFPYGASLIIGQSVVTFVAEDGSQTDYAVHADGTLAPTRSYIHSTLQALNGGYQLTTPDQHSLLFDSSGRLTAMHDPAGNGLAMSYAGSQLTSITDAAGRTVTFGYIGALLATVTLPGSRTVTYGYTSGRLTSVKDLRGQTTSYGYDPTSGLLTTVTDPLGHLRTSNTYDSAGRVTSQVDALGGKTTYSYDANNPGTTYVTDPDGGIWTEAYASGVISWQSDPYGKTTKYGYDSNLNRTSVTDPNGNTSTFTYDANGNLSASTAPVPLSTTDSWTYDAANRVTSYTDGLGHTATYTYNNAGQLTASTDPAGSKVTYTYTQLGSLATVTSPLGAVTTYGYDAASNRTSVTTALGEKTTFTYDPLGRVATETDPRGNLTGAASAAYTTSYSYDAGGLLTSTTDPLGDTTSYTYDADGQLTAVNDAQGATTSYGYDPAGNRTTVKDAAGSTTTSTYDSASNLTSVTDTLSDRTTYTYDKNNHRLTTVTARGNYSGASATAFTWTDGYDADGNQTSATDPTGAVTATTYDALDRPVTTTDPLGNTTTNTYDAVSNVIGVKDPLGNSTTYSYDQANRVASVTDPNNHTTTYGYDVVGNRTTVKDPLGDTTTTAYDADQRPIAVVDPRGNATGATPSTYTTTYGYDVVGNRTTVKDPLGDTTTTAYDALSRPTSVTDANGHTTTTAYDATSEVTAVTDPTGAVTSNTWNAVGDQTARTDANGHTTTYAYDPLHHLTSTTDPLGHTVRYSYDPEGHATTTTNARGATATTTYDARGLSLATTYTDKTPSVSRTYDQAGQPTSITDATGTRNLTYDQAGQLLAVSALGGTPGFTYGYDAAGNITSRQYPDGETYTYGYDADGRESQQTADSATTTYAYDPAGNLAATTLPGTNGYTETRSYDPADRLASIASTKGSTTLDSWQLTRDAVGQPTAVDAQRLGVNPDRQTYGYDADGRVTSAVIGGKSTAYTYDPVGNRKTANSTTYSYDQADELTTETVNPIIVIRFAYDADGNQTNTSSPGTSFTYDFNNHPIAYSNGAYNYTFTNDASGNRVSTYSGGSLLQTATWDINNPLPQLASQSDSSGAVTGDYGYDPLGLPQSQRTGGATYYDHHDWLGSITDLTDASGTQQSRISYDAFGNQTTTSVAASPPTSPFGFTGQYNDRITNTQDLRAREYDPQTGRLTSRDPLSAPSSPPGSSAYAYASNTPTVFSDPSGMSPSDPNAPSDMPWWEAIGSGLKQGVEMPAKVIGDVYDFATGQESLGQLVDKYFPVRPAIAYYTAAEKLREFGCDDVADFVEKHADQLAEQVAVTALGGLDSWMDKEIKSGSLGELREQGTVSRLLHGAREKEGLPGSAGIEIPSRPTASQLELLTDKHGVEFAVVYKLGPGPNGAGGTYYLYSGGVGSCRVPVAADNILIYHTHPGGARSPSDADRAMLQSFIDAGSPMRTSKIVPAGGEVTSFDTEGIKTTGRSWFGWGVR